MPPVSPGMLSRVTEQASQRLRTSVTLRMGKDCLIGDEINKTFALHVPLSIQLPHFGFFFFFLLPIVFALSRRVTHQFIEIIELFGALLIVQLYRCLIQCINLISKK